MAVTTEDLLKRAHELGDLIAEHPTAKKLEDVLRRLQADVEAQRAMNDYNRHLQALGDKEAQGRPIEVADKKKLEQLQNAVIKNAVLRDFQVAQMDYLDLMRRVDEAIQGGPAQPAGAPAGASPFDLGNAAPGAGGLNPDLAHFT